MTITAACSLLLSLWTYETWQFDHALTAQGIPSELDSVRSLGQPVAWMSLALILAVSFSTGGTLRRFVLIVLESKISSLRCRAQASRKEKGCSYISKGRMNIDEVLIG